MKLVNRVLPWAVAAACVSATACKNRAKEAEEQAMKEAAVLKKAQEVAEPQVPTETLSPPIRGKKTVPCEKLINTQAFFTALGEKEPMTITDATSTNLDAAATCKLMRGGTAMSTAEQQAALKKSGRLGVQPGDEICRVVMYCWTLETEDRTRTRCAELKGTDDESTGGYACARINRQGEDDQKSFRMFDSDTKCLIDVFGGPSNNDNDLIAKCAKTARDTISPDQINVE